MNAPPESAYRAARRAFIAACEVTKVDSIARVHPGLAGDSKPLFMDSAALGPRLARRAVLAIGWDDCTILATLLKPPVPLPADTRLVLVHAPSEADIAWLAAMLAAMAKEDLSRVCDLAVLPLAARGTALAAALGAALPKAVITLLPPAAAVAAARDAVAGFLRG